MYECYYQNLENTLEYKETFNIGQIVTSIKCEDFLDQGSRQFSHFSSNENFSIARG